MSVLSLGECWAKMPSNPGAFTTEFDNTNSFWAFVQISLSISFGRKGKSISTTLTDNLSSAPCLWCNTLSRIPLSVVLTIPLSVVLTDVQCEGNSKYDEFFANEHDSFVRAISVNCNFKLLLLCRNIFLCLTDSYWKFIWAAKPVFYIIVCSFYLICKITGTNLSQFCNFCSSVSYLRNQEWKLYCCK